MIKDRKSKNILIGGLLVAVLVMVVAYAALASNLQINGTANVSSTWNVEIISVTPDKTATNSGTAQNPNYTTPGDITHSITNNNLTANFDTALVSPGDTVTYTIVVQNKGTIDAMLNNTTKTDSNNPAITFTVNGLSEGERLNAGTSKTFTVVVGYPSNITEQPASTEGTLSLTLNYTQYDPNNTPSVVYSIANAYIGMPTVAGTYDAWCVVNVGDDYNSCTDANVGSLTQSECLAHADSSYGDTCSQGTITVSSNMPASNSGSGTGKYIYLRHTVRNNRITGSAVCFIKGGVEYCLTGGDNGAAYSTNINTLQTAFTENNACNDNGSDFACRASGFNAYTYASGGANITFDSWNCFIDEIGGSYCTGSGGSTDPGGGSPSAD